LRLRKKKGKKERKKKKERTILLKRMANIKSKKNNKHKLQIWTD